MTELTKEDLPAYEEFFVDVMQAIKDLGGSGTNQEIYAKVVELRNISDEELNVLHNEGPMTEIEYRLRWTQTYLKKDGLIENASRGVWSLLERGREISHAELSQTKARVTDIYREKQRA